MIIIDDLESRGMGIYSGRESCVSCQSL